MSKKIHYGFTLAEILITLGIIGVVAAMTIPTLIANTRSQQYRSRFKKTVSTLSQAARLSESLYGFDYAGINKKCGSNGAGEHPEEVMSICSLLNGTLSGAAYYEDAADIPMNNKNSGNNYSVTMGYFMNYSSLRNSLSKYHAYVLSDGTIVAFNKSLGDYSCTLSVGSSMADAHNYSDLAGCFGFIDVNGVQLPNKEVSCSSGSDSISKNTCIVKNDAEHMTDIYPIRFYDGIVAPASAAARYVLKSAK